MTKSLNRANKRSISVRINAEQKKANLPADDGHQLARLQRSFGQRG